MFQFRPFPTYTYFIQCTLLRYCRSGFPHSEISGSMRMCRSPKLIAACHVLRRLLMPRHSPCALYSLIYIAVLELCRHHIRLIFEIVIVLPFRSKVPQLFSSLFASLLPCFLHTLFVQFSRCKYFSGRSSPDGGDKRNRTADPLLAKQVLYQLSYTPV